MKMQIGQNLMLGALCLAGLAQASRAEDVYFHVPISSLKLVEGALPTEAGATRSRRWDTAPALQPYAVLDREGEVYIGGPSPNFWEPPNRQFANQIMAVRAPKQETVTGRLFVANGDGAGMTALKFRIEADQAKAGSREEFSKAKESHYRRLLERNIPGAAWFRHQEHEAAAARGVKLTDVPANAGQFRRQRSLEPDSTYELFSGGRAMNENLQLERLLLPAHGGEATVAMTNIAGITVREMDWKELNKGVKPNPDPLASFLPADQHALLFPSFSAMTELLDEADANGTPILHLLEPRAEDANTRGRYQKQLCLELNELSRLVGPQVIGSVAMTGSDPYLPTGSDVGILFEAKSPVLLKTYLLSRQAAALQTNSSCKSVNGEVAGVDYTGVVSPDRAISSYVAVAGDVVFVSNSLYQLGCLIKVAQGKTSSLATQDEYAYFRHRYPRDGKDETAFLILTDATIRRWCGPQWRIGNSRRSRAAALLAEVQAAHFDELVSGKLTPHTLPAERGLEDAGDLQLTSGGVRSSTYGTLEFLTPIAELPMTKVTQAEADAYNRWRTGYQQNWNQYFDPIAVRFAVSTRQLTAELAVMPLIAGTDYRQFITLSSGAKILPGAGDPHAEALFHFAMSINPESETIKGAGNFLGMANSPLSANPLGWLGQSLAIYADQDPFWDGLSKAERGQEFLEKNYSQLPVALHCEVKNSLGLATFLTALRGMVEQTAPKMTRWQNFEDHGQAYVKIVPSQAAGSGEMTNLAIYYAVTPKSLVLTLSEAVLKRALARQAEREAGKGEAGPGSAAIKPWLGTNLCLQLNPQFLIAFEKLARDDYQSAQQLLSWNNLPILNEWKRRYPAQDPVKLHEQFWQTKLICPGGGSYVWNDKWQTMESTVYGHPGEPKKGPSRVELLARIKSANLGLTFENQGLSAKAVVER